jgi:hypothetical protein
VDSQLFEIQIRSIRWYLYLFVLYSCAYVFLTSLSSYFTAARNDENDNETLMEGPSDSCDIDISEDDEASGETHPLHPNGAWFGGLQREFKLRYLRYWSDIKDGFHIQCLASLFYLAISITAMCLTYGQVICKYTMGNLGPVEMLSATSLSCILVAIFATEPLSVIAGTAAMLIVESSTYQVSSGC